MKAMIFAAGLGTRLRPLTDHKPKALVEVGGKTLLEIQLEKLANVGFTDIVVNVHHFADQIKNFLNNYKDKDKINCRISDESAKLLNTGGGLKFAFNDGINEPVLIHNVDILSDANLSFLYETCKQCDAVLLVSERQTQRYLLFDNDMRMVGWTNIATGEVRSPYPDINVENCRRFAFAGIHVVSPTIIQAMQKWPDEFSIMDFYIMECNRLHIQGVCQDGLRLLDVGKIDALQKATEYL